MAIMEQTPIYDLRTNGTDRRPGTYEEVGTPGIETYSGFVFKAYNSELYWPQVEPVYTRIHRSDPEVTIVRQLFSAWAGRLDVGVELPERIGNRELGPPTDADNRAVDYLYEVLEDLEGGIGAWLTDCVTRVPFYGWGWWEAVPGLRRENWTPPGRDPWRSQFNDNLLGLRGLRFRDYSSFDSWDIDERTGRVHGLYQYDAPNDRVLIPSERSIHIRYGDRTNPEGLATLEAMWRLERLLYGYEVVQGIGYEHTAGHLSVTVEEGEFDKAEVNRAARALLSAQQGNYAAWPKGTKGEIIDTPFAAAAALEVTKQNIRILKLALLGMQFVAISTMSGSGSYAALDDSSEMAVLIFNGIAEDAVRQLDSQLTRRLLSHPANAQAFAGRTRLPRLTVNTLSKAVKLPELAQFATAMSAVMPLGDDDFIAIRSKSDVLPEQLPEAPEDETADGEATRLLQEQVLNGAQIASALHIISAFNQGEFPRENAVFMIETFFNIPRGVAERIVPSDARPQVEQPVTPAVPEPEPEPEPPAATEGEDAPPLGETSPAEMAQAAVAEFARWAAEHRPDVAAALQVEVTK